jgi:2,5-diamino-6-(ribosylamino)-4(3H)-pyrimidinone 5'-phosphate reductase
MNNRPYVLLNVAMSLDGKIDTYERRGCSISSAEDKERVDRLRAESDAVMVGGRTLLDEDPRLTVKSAARRAERSRRGLPPNPAKVGVVTQANLSPTGHFLTAGPAQIFIFTTPQTEREQVDRLRQLGVEVWVAEGPRVDLAEALRRLHQAGVKRLLVEGGGVLNEALLRLGLVDEVSVYIAPLIFGGAGAPTLASGPGLKRAQALALQLTALERHDDGGIVLHYHCAAGEPAAR